MELSTSPLALGGPSLPTPKDVRDRSNGNGHPVNFEIPVLPPRDCDNRNINEDTESYKTALK